MSEAAHEHPNYVKIWAVLVALLVVSVLGPMAEIRLLTLFAAFGIALIKAYLVLKNFMHVNLVPRFVTYLLVTSLVFMLLLFAGTATDVRNARGSNWTKPTWLAAKAAAAEGQGAAHH